MPQTTTSEMASTLPSISQDEEWTSIPSPGTHSDNDSPPDLDSDGFTILPTTSSSPTTQNPDVDFTQMSPCHLAHQSTFDAHKKRAALILASDLDSFSGEKSIGFYFTVMMRYVQLADETGDWAYDLAVGDVLRVMRELSEDWRELGEGGEVEWEGGWRVDGIVAMEREDSERGEREGERKDMFQQNSPTEHPTTLDDDVSTSDDFIVLPSPHPTPKSPYPSSKKKAAALLASDETAHSGPKSLDIHHALSHKYSALYPETQQRQYLTASHAAMKSSTPQEDDERAQMSKKAKRDRAKTAKKAKKAKAEKERRESAEREWQTRIAACDATLAKIRERLAAEDREERERKIEAERQAEREKKEKQQLRRAAAERKEQEHAAHQARLAAMLARHLSKERARRARIDGVMMGLLYLFCAGTLVWKMVSALYGSASVSPNP